MQTRTWEQLEHEDAAWLRSLDFLQQENIMLKNRLAEIMRYRVDNAVLEKAEHYQNIFLDKDAVLALLRHEVKQTEAMVRSSGDGNDRNLTRQQNRLRRDMEQMEKEFSRLKADFNAFCLAALGLS